MTDYNSITCWGWSFSKVHIIPQWSLGKRWLLGTFFNPTKLKWTGASKQLCSLGRKYNRSKRQTVYRPLNPPPPTFATTFKFRLVSQVHSHSFRAPVPTHKSVMDWGTPPAAFTCRWMNMILIAQQPWGLRRGTRHPLFTGSHINCTVVVQSCSVILLVNHTHSTVRTDKRKPESESRRQMYSPATRTAVYAVRVWAIFAVHGAVRGLEVLDRIP